MYADCCPDHVLPFGGARSGSVRKRFSPQFAARVETGLPSDGKRKSFRQFRSFFKPDAEKFRKLLSKT